MMSIVVSFQRPVSVMATVWCVSVLLYAVLQPPVICCWVHLPWSICMDLVHVPKR